MTVECTSSVMDDVRTSLPTPAEELARDFPGLAIVLGPRRGEPSDGSLSLSRLEGWMQKRGMLSFQALSPELPAAGETAMVELVLQYLRGNPRGGYGLRVQASRIEGAGQGLFAATNIAQGTLLCVYSGTRRSLKETADATAAKQSDYIMGFGLRDHVDAGPHLDVLARYVNDTFTPGGHNAEFFKVKSDLRAMLVASRDIAEGEEVYAKYGESYWRPRGREDPYGAGPMQ
eukprot:Hpha_TRINITY_DN16242_c0_g3::TRINITY_DN16242_c0_g3_i1::g.12823::m.12823